MLYGLYQSAQGIQAQSSRIDVVANNLANAGTSGFKRDLAIFQSNRPYDLDHAGGSEPPGNQNALSGGVTTAQIATDFAPVHWPGREVPTTLHSPVAASFKLTMAGRTI